MEMTMDEAIDQLESFHSWFGLDFGEKDLAAIQMGVEALKLIKAADFSGGAHTFKGKSVEQCVLIPKDQVAAGPFADLLKE
jgi:hypothetical protein